MIKILFAASEAVPFIKTGGLADVVGSLPKYFDPRKYDVRVMIPRYLCMDEKYKKQLQPVMNCMVELGWRSQYAGVLETKVDDITYYFIDNEYYFAGPAPYGQIYQDAEKFAFFSMAVLKVLPELGFKPDIIHCNDWQTGLLPVFLKSHFAGDPFYKDTRTVYTIHNMKFQGRWHIDCYMDFSGLSSDYFTIDTMESYGEANSLKGGIVFSDEVTTVSDTYAKEITYEEGGEGLHGLMRSRRDHLRGILNGLDYDVFDPSKDPVIAANFDAANFKEKKPICKEAMQNELGLKADADAFVIGMVSRLTDQKGFDLVDYMMERILENPKIQIVVLGTGEERYERMFRYFAGKYEGRVSANTYYSEDVAHRIYAGCDAFLMPSKFEPCGLSQLMSLRYGTVPMVRETGGLKDTVEAYNPQTGTGTGFTFCDYNAHEMLFMIEKAYRVYADHRDEWDDMIERGMQKDFSWNRSAKKYMELYETLLQVNNTKKTSA